MTVSTTLELAATTAKAQEEKSARINLCVLRVIHAFDCAESVHDSELIETMNQLRDATWGEKISMDDPANCGACTVAIGSHTNQEGCRNA